MSIIPGTSTKSSKRSRLRTLQKRLNLKKSVTQPSSDKKSHTSGLKPRSETSAPRTVTSSIRLERDGFSRELRKGIQGRALFGLFLVPAPGRGIPLAADQRGDLEALGMVWAFLIEQQVSRRLAKLALGHLLEVALVIDPA